MSTMRRARRRGKSMFRFLFIGMLATVCCVGAHGAGNTDPLPPSIADAVAGETVVICAVRGEINLGVAAVVKRAVNTAENARVFILVVDTPGGRVDAALDIANALMELDCPVIAYIESTGAISAGALISFACDKMVMAPGTSIGAATPFMPGVETDENIDEKSMSFVRSRFRALAEEKGHDPLLGEAMVDRSIGVYGYKDEDGRLLTARAELDEDGNAVRPDGVPEDARVISLPGKLLTLTTSEAEELGLAAYKARSLDEMLEREGLASLARVEVAANWSEQLFAFLTNPIIAGLLLMLGLGGLYVEIRTPGLGFPGLLGVVCLALFFGSNMVLGLAGWVDVLLVVVGLGLLMVELFLLPGFGLAGAAGIVCILTGLLMSMTRVPIPEFVWDYQRLADAVTAMGVMIASLGAFALLSWRVFPRSPLFRWLVLAEAQEGSGGYVVQTDEEERHAMGLRGVTVTVLRPAGRGRFEGRTMDIVTRGEYIEAGRPVRIIAVEGNRYVVTEDEENPAR
jgi:membrane-bound serine protease (ClpP class)